MTLQTGVHSVKPEQWPRVVEVWEASVRATHHFITEANIQFFRPLVNEGVKQIQHLRCVQTTAQDVVGFIGVAEHKIEMLFIHPDWRGQGIGKQLTTYAVEKLDATAVDVNEQNEQAVGFYQRMGFVVQGRSELDSTNKPYPILHMTLAHTSPHGLNPGDGVV